MLTTAFLTLTSLLLLSRDCNLGIPNPRIPGSRPFSPIPNSGIGSVPIPEFWDYKNALKLYFFRMSNDRNRNFSRLIKLIKYLMSAKVLFPAAYCTGCGRKK